MKKTGSVVFILMFLTGVFLGLTGCSLTKYTVSTESSNTQAGVVMGSGVFQYGEIVTLSAESLDESSYEWQGWYIDNLFYTDKLSFDYIVQKKDITFTAKWSGILVPVYCYSNLENNYPQNMNYSNFALSYGVTGNKGLEWGTKNLVIYDSEILDIEGYKFLGWYSDKNFENKVTDNQGNLLSISTYKGQVFLYAKWEIIKSDLTVSSNSGLTQISVYTSDDGLRYNLAQTNNFDYGTHIKIEVINSGLDNGQTEFERWSTQSGLVVDDDLTIIFDMPEYDVDLEAVFTLPENQTEVEIDGNNVKIVNYFGTETVLILNDRYNLNGQTYKLTSIKKGAFSKASNLKKVVLPYTVNSVDDGAFYDVNYSVLVENGVNVGFINERVFNKQNCYLILEEYLKLMADENPSEAALYAKNNIVASYFAKYNGVVATDEIGSNEEYYCLYAYQFFHGITQKVLWRITISQLNTTSINFLHERYLTAYKRSNIFFQDDATQKYYFNLNKYYGDDELAQSSKEDFYNNYYGLNDNNDIFYRNSNTNLNSFSTNPSGTRELKINEVENYNYCYSSEDLLCTIENGYRPMFVSDDCPAKIVYDRAVSILRSICDDTMSDYEKVVAIHDYIVTNTVNDRLLSIFDNIYSLLNSNNENKNQQINAYRLAMGLTEEFVDQIKFELNKASTEKINYNVVRYKHSSMFLEGVLLHGVANYHGYTKAFLLLCKLEGIDCIRYFGSTQYSDSLSSSNYVWNKVKLTFDGQEGWYNVDVANDDVLINKNNNVNEEYRIDNNYEVLTHLMFLLSDEDMYITSKDENQGVRIQRYIFNGGNTGSYEYESLLSQRFYYYEHITFEYNGNVVSAFTQSDSDMKALADAIMEYGTLYNEQLSGSLFIVEVCFNGDEEEISDKNEKLFTLFNTKMMIGDNYTQNYGESAMTQALLIFSFEIHE